MSKPAQVNVINRDYFSNTYYIQLTISISLSVCLLFLFFLAKPVAVSSSSETVGNLKFREKTRRLPPSLKLTDPTSRPPIVLSGLGPGLDQAQLSNGMNLNGHLPQISVSNSHVQLKKETDVGDDILASMARLNAQLDILED